MKRIVAACILTAFASSGTVLAAPSAASAPAPPRSAPVVVEKVVAVVDDRFIFRSELLARIRPFLAKLPTDPLERRAAHDELIKAMLSKMTDEAIVTSECAKLGIHVDGFEIDAAMKLLAAQNKISVPDLKKHATAVGFTESEYVAELRRQLLMGKWIQRAVVPKIDPKAVSDPKLLDAAIEAKRKETMDALRRGAHIEVRL